MDSLQAAARELETRWKWAEARLDVDWSATTSFGRVRPQPAKPTNEETAEIERLRTRNDKLANMDDDGWTEEMVEEADANETRLDEIEATIEARAVYRREDIAIAGCIATVGNDGELKLIQGLVRPEDMPAREAGEADAAGHDDTGDGEDVLSGIEAPTFVAPLASPGDAEAEARKEAGIGIGLADDLRAIRTAIVKSQLACDFEAAFDLLLFQLARSVFTNGYHDDALDIRATETPDRPAMRVNDDAFGDINVGEKHLEIDRAAQKLDWTGLPDAEAFAELRALPERDKRTLFASCVARTLKGQLAFEPKARPEVEATVARLDIDFAAAVRGNRDQVWTADLLWSRLRKDRILAIARETLGETWALAEAKQKKADIAKAMEDAFAHGNGVPAGVTAEGRAAAVAWTPPGFRAFDTGNVDDRASADDEGTTAPEPQPSKIDMPSVDALEHSSVDPSGPDSEAPQDDATEANALRGDDPEPTPVEAQQPMNARVHSVVESIDAPAAAKRRAAALASNVNADATPSVEREQVLAPPRGNGHDNGAELLEIRLSCAAAEPPRPSSSTTPRWFHTGGAFFIPVSTTRRFQMSTVQNAVTAEAGDSSATIRARVGDSAIDKVTRLFSASLADIFTETLQNSRRGGANRVAATIEQDGDTTRVTLIDDGVGIADPAVLLTFGKSNWKAGIAEAEDPAGFGLLALSRRGCTLRWRVPGGDPSPGYRLGAGARSLSRPRCGACRPGRQRPLAPWNRCHLRGVRGAPRGPCFP